jgi:large subunit ribosomal protein L24
VKTTQPRKQRKMLFNAPAHIRYKHFSAPLSPSLKASHNVGSLPVRTGDTVRVMRGDRKGLEGKVSSVDRKKYRINVEGITREKVDGTAIQVPIHPSKVMITSLNLDDKWRRESLKVGVTPPEEEKKPEEKKTKRKRKPKKPEEPKKQERKKRTRKATAEKKEEKVEKVEEEKTEESESG